ncbi:MAG: hypothetical protein WKG07_37400 [Hymenobacter sp.]
MDQWYESARHAPPPYPTPAEQAAAKARAWRQIRHRTQPRPTWSRRPAVRWALAALVILGLSLGLGLGWQRTVPQPPAGLATRTAGPGAGQLTIARAARGYLVATNGTARPLPWP